jgi:hypothetical protein
MSDDDMRQRIARLDPTAGAATDPITSPEARALLEEIMSTPVIESETTTPAGGPEHRRKRFAMPALIGTAAAVVLAVGLIAVRGRDDGGGEVADAPIATTATTAPGKLKVVELSAPADDIMAMCMAITPELLADTQVAFKGTVDTSEGEIVTLTIDEVYKGTDAQVATLVAPAGMEALIGGIAFEPGQQYLITATDGIVNYCGFSGPATPELQALFDQAFAAG